VIMKDVCTGTITPRFALSVVEVGSNVTSLCATATAEVDIAEDVAAAELPDTDNIDVSSGVLVTGSFAWVVGSCVVCGIGTGTGEVGCDGGTLAVIAAAALVDITGGTVFCAGSAAGGGVVVAAAGAAGAAVDCATAAASVESSTSDPESSIVADVVVAAAAGAATTGAAVEVVALPTPTASVRGTAVHRLPLIVVIENPAGRFELVAMMKNGDSRQQ